MSRFNNVQLGAALWGVLIGLGLAIAIAACAQGSQSARTPVAAGPADASMGRATLDPDKQDIQELWNQIRDWRKEEGMPPDPLIDLTRRPDIIQNSVDKIRQCPAEEQQPKTEVCQDVCGLKEKICENAEDICRIADKLGDDDDWARRKCNSAKASCKEATDKCCGCLADEKPKSTQPGGG